MIIEDDMEFDDGRSAAMTVASRATTLSMLPGTQGEKEFFKLLWLANILNIPDVLVD